MMKYTDLLTIAMPCYERKEFFKEALESALNQTVKCKVIVIDNCSSHNYFEKICSEKNVTYFRNEKNIGIIGNFSKGFELSDTKYTMNLQDDDILSEIYVQSFLEALEKHPDLDIYFSDFELFSSKGNNPHKHTLPFGYMKNGERIIEYGIKYKLGFPYMSSVIKTKIAHRYSEIKDNAGSFDWEWIYSKADKFSFYGEERKLYNYRQHGNQDTKKNCNSYLLTISYIYEKILLEKVTSKRLKSKASWNAFWILLYLRSISYRNEWNELKNGKSKYEEYFKSKIKNCKLLRYSFLLPRRFTYIALKSVERMGVRF